MKLLLLSLSLLLLITTAAVPQDETLSYLQTTVANLAAGKVQMTRAQLTGFVTYVTKEGDGDIHIRVCDSAAVTGMDKTHCIVAEIMPDEQGKVTKPKVGQEVTLQGITRFDGEHKWYELHPLTGLK